ncbi:serine/threonine-protein kinase pelle-like [Anopheles albimanus]|uniref:non-specific serine/threonine protein kinase n=1 Tax=Anopheles albimanus TaxID=7167 RepID=A0A182FNP1_ANOAL|nr:serine/threonine-protein kinase pelle-like [Anopheles albimanus]
MPTVMAEGIPTTSSNPNGAEPERNQAWLVFKYIYDIPSTVRKSIANILDRSNKWYELGTKQMGFTAVEMDNLKQCSTINNRSTGAALLDKWANYNHSPTELFIVLSHEKLYDCMDLMKQFVDPRYHVLIKPLAERAPARPLQQATLNEPVAESTSKLLNGDPPPANEPRGSLEAAGNVNDDNPFANEITDVSQTPRMSYAELTKATDNWSEQRILGKGGFGTVYLGVFKHTYMAIKRIDQSKLKTSAAGRLQLEQSFNELRFLNACRHDNIVPVFGFSVDKEPCIVYQYMAGGSLDKSLFARRAVSTLTWKERMNIACGTARGLQYLHTFGAKPFIHGDIKPGNILLTESKQPRIGDFGLTRQGAADDSATVISRVYGTRPYIPKEFYDRKVLSTKVDTYSFGVVLFEIATGLRAWDERRLDKHLKDVMTRAIHEKVLIAELMDKKAAKDRNGALYCYYMLLHGHACTADDPSSRPDMVTVMKHLENVFRGSDKLVNVSSRLCAEFTHYASF